MAKLNIFGSNKNDEDNEEAGKAVEAKFTALEEGNKKTLETVSTLAESVKAMNDRFAREDKAREDAEKARKAEEARKAAAARTSEDDQNELLDDPRKFIRNANADVTNLALITAGKQTRAEVLGEKPYYYGDFKSKVDKLIEAEPNLVVRAGSAFIENCYKVILADHVQEIQEGKLKQRASMHYSSDGSSQGTKTESDDKPKVEYIDNKSRYAASMLGLKDEDIIGAAKSREIKGLEVAS